MEMAQVGVRTRARALALAAAAAAATAAVASTTTTPRKRKVKNQELIMSTSYIELRSTTSTRTRRRVMINNTPENSVSVSPEVNPGQRTVIKNRCSSNSSDHASASCCSSNGSSHDHERIKNKISDLEDGSVEVETSVYYSCRESRRETTPSSQLRPESSDELDSTARPSSSEANTRRRSETEKMPTESELDEFFTEAEKNIQKQFADKFNFDIIKDEPLPGRYEWVRLKP